MRRPRGCARKIIGVSSSSASPSTPAYAVPERDLISNVSQLNSKAWPLRDPWPARARVTTSAACAPVAAVTANTPSCPVSRRRRWDVLGDAAST